MIEPKVRFRDWLAAPFMTCSAFLENLAVDIGGPWTTHRLTQQIHQTSDYLKQRKFVLRDKDAEAYYKIFQDKNL